MVQKKKAYGIADNLIINKITSLQTNLPHDKKETVKNSIKKKDLLQKKNCLDKRFKTRYTDKKQYMLNNVFYGNSKQLKDKQRETIDNSYFSIKSNTYLSFYLFRSSHRLHGKNAKFPI